MRKVILYSGLFVLVVLGLYTLNLSPESNIAPAPDLSAQTSQTHAEEQSPEAIPVSENMQSVNVNIVNATSHVIGTAKLTQQAKGVLMEVNVTGLTPPGKHGIHIHEKAFRGTDFATAGGHLNPYGKEHGLENPKGPHLGDMPNLEVQANGAGKGKFNLPGATLEPGKENSLRGKSIIIHAKEDDQKTNPAGNSGDRIAGGNIPE
ncbi:superoxide dismutase family protein [Ammoniphilus resinae]|nr:superoxide dismutase family protein [Ammoniphilus resinae]